MTSTFDARFQLMQAFLKKVEGTLRTIEESERKKVPEAQKLARKAKDELARFLQNPDPIPDWLERNRILALLRAKFEVSEKVNYLNYLRDAWKDIILRNPLIFDSDLAKWWKTNFGAPQFSDVLPQGTWLLSFTLKLEKSYISRDDEQLYIIDNPVKKDKVFGVPFVPGSTWKGNLHWAALKVRLLDRLYSLTEQDALEQRAVIVRLFGNENKNTTEKFLDEVLDKQYLEIGGERPSQRFARLIKEKKYVNDSGLRAGRLIPFPSFFDEVGLEVLNPHNRRSRAGTLPIILETVPENATSSFNLLYVPFDLIGKDELTEETKEDLKTSVEAVVATMLTYGFSAKKTSGYGLAKPQVDGKLWTNSEAVATSIKGLSWKKRNGVYLVYFDNLKKFAQAVSEA